MLVEPNSPTFWDPEDNASTACGVLSLSLDDDCGRLNREFCEIRLIGQGVFSRVYFARNRIDKKAYAVKVAQQSLKEAEVLASLVGSHVIRYFSSWVEDGRLHMQTELCHGSVRDRLVQRQAEGSRFHQEEVTEVLLQVASGLHSLHSCNFVHLDIKPDNILVGQDGLFKIADLGLAVATEGYSRGSVFEGDSRYFARELLEGQISDLRKADIFSLGLSCYELATNRALPSNGEEWQQLRDGQLDRSFLEQVSDKTELLCKMVHPTPSLRPTASEVMECGAEQSLEALSRALREARQAEMDSRRRADELQCKLEMREVSTGLPVSPCPAQGVSLE